MGVVRTKQEPSKHGLGNKGEHERSVSSGSIEFKREGEARRTEQRVKW